MRVLNLFYIPSDSVKASNWKDGYTSAIDILRETHEVTDCNLARHKPDFSLFDIVIVKSNWGWIVDKYFIENRSTFKGKSIIMISGSAPLPPHHSIYDVLMYETDWYRSKYLQGLTNTIQGFGIDTSIMKPLKYKRKYDWIGAGKIIPAKMFHTIKESNGVVVGEKTDINCINQIHANGNITMDYVDYKSLCSLINKSKVAYLPMNVNSGGERFLLEAMACGIDTIIRDNPKLENLKEQGVLSHIWYAEQLEKAIQW
jgi:hypothetical protein